MRGRLVKPILDQVTLLPAAATGLAIAIFVVDTLTPPDCVVSGLYVLVVLLAGQVFQGRKIWYVCLGCVFLALLSQILSHRLIISSDQLLYIGAVNEAVSIVTILMSGYLVQRGLASEIALARARADLAHISRVTTLGELTASIAHEVNQPIAGVVANAGACLRWLASDPPQVNEASAAAARIVRDGSRAAEIITRIRQIFIKGSPEKGVTDINSLIRETAELLNNEALRYGVSINLELETEVRLMADPIQLQQVIVNLFANAIDAMKEEGHPRTLIVSSCRNEDGGVAVTVSDTGKGIPAAEETRIFDAFFTTKPQGTGMGLSISRSIIEAHQGKLVAERRNPRGTAFRFTIPARLDN